MEILQKLNALDFELGVQSDYQTKTEKLRKIIRDYLNIDNLTPLILNKLIEIIQVGHVEKVDGQMVQEITIVWRFAGLINGSS